MAKETVVDTKPRGRPHVEESGLLTATFIALFSEFAKGVEKSDVELALRQWKIDG